MVTKHDLYLRVWQAGVRSTNIDLRSTFKCLKWPICAFLIVFMLGQPAPTFCKHVCIVFVTAFILQLIKMTSLGHETRVPVKNWRRVCRQFLLESLGNLGPWFVFRRKGISQDVLTCADWWYYVPPMLSMEFFCPIYPMLASCRISLRLSHSACVQG